MKHPKIEFAPMYLVEDWGAEIIHGVGAPLTYQSYLIEETRILFYQDGKNVPTLEFPSKVFTRFEAAEVRLTQEREKRLEYYKRQIVEAEKNIKELKEKELEKL